MKKIIIPFAVVTAFITFSFLIPDEPYNVDPNAPCAYNMQYAPQ